jgi:receptor protein-tyrosine kinase
MVNQYLAATYSELMTKRPVVETAIRNLGWAPLKVDEWMEHIEVWVVPNTSVIILTVKAQDPRRAMNLANELVSVFIQAQNDPRDRQDQDIAIVEPAYLPTEPVAPRILLNTLVAAVAGAVLAGAVALLIEYLDNALSTPQEIRQTLSLPTLAAVPRVRSRKKRRAPIVLSAPKSSAARAYHTLRTRIQLSGAEPRDISGTILITSPLSRKEKAGVTVNLGVALAQAGLSVLLVDADLHSPQLHEAFELSNETGLTTIAQEGTEALEQVADTGIPNLRVLCRGPLPADPSALWSPQQMSRIVKQLGRLADVVLFDGPPVLETPDAMMLASQTDSAILSIESQVTSKEAAAQALESLESVQANVLGIVLNRARGKRYRVNGYKR